MGVSDRYGAALSPKLRLAALGGVIGPARPLLRQGHRGLAGFGVAAGAVSGISLLLASSKLPTGLFQRLGLTAVDLWIVASAVAIASGAVRPMPQSRSVDHGK